MIDQLRFSPYFWSNVNQKAKITERTLNIGPMKIWDFSFNLGFFYPVPDHHSHNLITSSFGPALPT